MANDNINDLVINVPAEPAAAHAFFVDAMAFDVPRIWCTALAVANSGSSYVLIIAKEVLSINGVGDDKPQLSRNVASLMMPGDAAIGLRDALLKTFPLAAVPVNGSDNEA